MIVITNEEHQYNGELSEGDKITIYINDQPTPVSYTVNQGYKGLITLRR
jgi:hypothetical protein